jgi:hypothetical protein
MGTPGIGNSECDGLAGDPQMPGVFLGETHAPGLGDGHTGGLFGNGSMPIFHPARALSD